jgi:hypothetical protein
MDKMEIRTRAFSTALLMAMDKMRSNAVANKEWRNMEASWQKVGHIAIELRDMWFQSTTKYPALVDLIRNMAIDIKNNVFGDTPEGIDFLTVLGTAYEIVIKEPEPKVKLCVTTVMSHPFQYESLIIFMKHWSSTSPISVVSSVNPTAIATVTGISMTPENGTFALVFTIEGTKTIINTIRHSGQINICRNGPDDSIESIHVHITKTEMAT